MQVPTDGYTATKASCTVWDGSFNNGLIVTTQSLTSIYSNNEWVMDALAAAVAAAEASLTASGATGVNNTGISFEGVTTAPTP